MIREIIIPDTNTVLIALPDGYIGKTVEVIAFTTDESSRAKQKPVPSFEELRIDTTHFRFNRNDSHGK